MSLRKRNYYTSGGLRRKKRKLSSEQDVVKDDNSLAGTGIEHYGILCTLFIGELLNVCWH